MTYELPMQQSIRTKQQHSLSTIRVTKEPVKEVEILVDDETPISWKDLQGLTWTLFEERVK